MQRECKLKLDKLKRDHRWFMRSFSAIYMTYATSLCVESSSLSYSHYIIVSTNLSILSFSLRLTNNDDDNDSHVDYDDHDDGYDGDICSISIVLYSRKEVFSCKSRRCWNRIRSSLTCADTSLACSRRMRSWREEVLFHGWDHVECRWWSCWVQMMVWWRCCDDGVMVWWWWLYGNDMVIMRRWWW